MTTAPSLNLTRCSDCHGLYLPRPGTCPRCGSHAIQAASGSPHGRLVAGVVVEYPPVGFAAPHRLALVELPDAVSVLAGVDGELPPPGSPVTVRLRGDRYVAERGR